MAQWIGVLTLALLLVTAGCLSGPFDGDSQTRTPGEHTTQTDDSETETSNPWGKATLTVGIDHAGDSWHNITGLVADTLQYWDRYDDTYGTYEVGFELRPDAADPDVVVRYVEDISVCGSVNRDGGAGFAPKISPGASPEPPESICVRRGYNEASARHILKHEFGHLLGISHGESPENLMRADYAYLPVPRPDQRVLAAPTVDGQVSVYVDRSTIYARRNLVAKQQLDHAFTYYERETDLLDSTPAAITLVENESDADIVVTFPRQSPCERNRVGSCGTVEPRQDGQSQFRVAITTTHEDTYGWHAGFWLGVALGAETHDMLPPPFRNASFDERHSEWWV